jgi:hypothetical protein
MRRLANSAAPENDLATLVTGNEAEFFIETVRVRVDVGQEIFLPHSGGKMPGQRGSDTFR